MRISLFRRLLLPIVLLANLSLITILCIVHVIPPSDNESDDVNYEMMAMKMRPESVDEYLDLHMTERIPQFLEPQPEKSVSQTILPQSKQSAPQIIELHSGRDALQSVEAQPGRKGPQLVKPQKIQPRAQTNHMALPSIEEILPYLRNAPSALEPSLVYPNESQQRSKARLVIGVPTVPREKQSYLSVTLQSLAFGLSAKQQQSTIIVIMIGSLEGGDTTLVKEQISLIDAEFKEYLSSGVFRVIVPPPEWYPPDLNSVEPNLGDSPQRMFWRTKQNLDYMFLMLYCRSLGEYYLQVEDDVLAKSNYMNKIEEFLEMKGRNNWFTVDFASLGFIGKLFHSYDLSYMIHYIALLYRYRPVDWILDTIFIDRYCAPFEMPKNCSKMWKRHRIQPATLFQHVGVHSSLTGKVQNMKEKNFGQSNTFNAHRDNPPATLTTSLPQYDGYGIQRLYDGLSLFWSSRSPIMGDFVLIQFANATSVKGLLIRSGNAEHRHDKLDNNTVILYKDAEDAAQFKEMTAFNERGVARYEFAEPQLLDSVLIEIRANYSSWLLLSELHIRR